MRRKCTKTVIETICELIKTDSYTVVEMCAKVGISIRSYYNWKKENAHFAHAIKKAKEEANDMRLVECKNSLVRLINGYEYEETHTEESTGEDGETKIIKIKTIRKHVQPNLGAIIHFQTNQDPDNWKNRQSVEAEVDTFSHDLMARVAKRKEREKINEERSANQ